MKEWIVRRKQEDLERVERDVKAGGIQPLLEAVKDPLTKIVGVDKALRVAGYSPTRIKIIQLGLRFMEGLGVPIPRANSMALSFGHEGKTAWYIERYDAAVKEKWGAQAKYLTDDLLRKTMNTTMPKIAVIRLRSNEKYTDNLDVYFENRVLLLRAAIKAMEPFDITPEEVAHWMTFFGPAGAKAMYSEDYAAKHLSRRERTRR